MKTCTKCRAMKSDFPKNKRMADKFSSWCRGCHRQRRRDDYAKNPEKYKSAAKRYALKNRLSIARRAKAYALRNREKLKSYKQRWANKNRKFLKSWHAKYYRMNEKKIRARSSLWRKLNRPRALECMKNRQLKILYGVDRKWLQAAIKNQKGLCAICSCEKPGGIGTWHVDHDHKTGEIRGLLCSYCNLGLGYFEDSQVILLSAANYLEHSFTGLLSIPGRGRADSRAARLKRTHGLTLTRFTALFKSQKRRCKICLKSKPRKVQSSVWKVDHDHLTMKIRGILCGKCNLGLGYFRDDTEILSKAVLYLKFPKCVRKTGT